MVTNAAEAVPESATMEDVATTSRNFRLPDEVYVAALGTAKDESEKLPAVVIRALRAYTADPQAFNATCANIVREARQ